MAEESARSGRGARSRGPTITEDTTRDAAERGADRRSADRRAVERRSADRRAAAARRLAAGDRRSALDRLCELATALLDTESAQVSVVSDVQVVAGGAGGARASVGQQSPAEDSLCTVTMLGEAPLVVPDARGDDRVRDLVPVASGAVGSYLGVPLFSADGHSVGALCVHDPAPRRWSERDVTTLERLAASVVAELELAALSAEFEAGQVVWRLATDAAEVGAFDLDLVTGELRWDDRLLDLFGLDRVTFSGSMESFNKAVHPEDLPRVLAALDVAVQTCGEYAAEYRILLPHGELRWIAARGRALVGEDGTAARLIGAAFDTTASQESEARVARVLESMPTAFFSVDRAWRFSYVNAEAERLLESRRDDLLGRDLWEAFPAAIGTDFETHYRDAVDSREPVAFDAYYPAPLDKWYEVRAWPNPDGLAVYFVDVTARQQAQEQVARAARRAALLADVTQQLTGTLDLGEAVSRLGALVVPGLGDWCVATLVVDEGREGRPPILRDVGGWHRDPAQQGAVDGYVATRLAALADGAVLPSLLAASRPLAVNGGATEQLCELYSDDEVRALVRSLAPESVAIVPLRGRDRVVGLLTVFGDAARGGFTDDDLDTLAEVATRAGLAVDNARLFAEQRDLAEGLQRSMLTPPPQPDDLQVVVRYEAAAMTAQVGGDWYDAFVQPGGATVLVIGDMVGHDTAAAAAMGQVRSMLRAIAVHSGAGPADVLRGVDRAFSVLGVETTATAVVARLEQTPEEVDEQVTRLRWSNAGHPPPVVLCPDGTVQVLDEQEAGLLLGLDDRTDRVEHELTVERGTTVLLYTDGLVERRGEDLETGLARLRNELERLAATTPDLDRLCDRLLARMVPSRREDDIALVAVRLHPQRDGGQDGGAAPATAAASRNRLVQARFAADPASVPGVRRFVRDALHPRPDGTLAEDAELCISELAGNAALHSGSAFLDVAVRVDGEGVTLTVSDDGPVPPEAVVPRLVVHGDGREVDPDAEATTGRGLGIVAVLAAEWGVERTPTGKHVWARLTGDGGDHPVRPPDTAPQPAVTAGELLRSSGDDALPDGWGRVLLLGCPVDLGLRQDEHLDDLIRELRLLDTGSGDLRSQQVARELRELLAGPAHARHLGRRTALEAAAAGLAVVDIDMVAPREAGEAVLRMQELVTEADRLCEREQLLTLASSPELRELRAWMTHEVSGQLREGATPVTWEAWQQRSGG